MSSKPEGTPAVPVPAENVPLGYGKRFAKSLNFWHDLGPGLTTGASDDDPSGIATYSQTGAQYGTQLIWLSLYTFPLMAVVQEMCARIGLVTGRGLAGNIRLHFPRWVLYVCAALLFAANAFNIGADLGAMAKASQLIFPHFRFSFLVIGFAVVGLLLQIFTTYQRYSRYLKWLALILLAYIFSALSVPTIHWASVLKDVVIPTIHWNKDQFLIISAILGTTISPYLFFWQTSQEVEEEILAGKTSIAQRVRETYPEDIKKMRTDVWSGMLLSNVVMFFIIAACGATLFQHGITQITTAADAAEALRPFAGDAAYTLFALGIVGTGMLAIPVLAGSSSYALSESFGWKEGLYRRLNQARAFYAVIAVSTLLGLAMNFIGLDPIKALIYSAIGNALVAPVVLVLILLMAGNSKIMGNWVSSKVSRFFGWVITIFMIISGIAAIWSLFR